MLEGNMIRRNYIHDIVNEGPDGIIRLDFKNQDFRLKPESPMFKLGFKQIETGQIGLREGFPERFRNGL